MQQRDRVVIWVAKKLDNEDYQLFATPYGLSVNFTVMDTNMLMEVTGQTDTGYASFIFPKRCNIQISTGDRIYLQPPTNYDALAVDADYEVTAISGKRYMQVTARALS